MKQTIILIVTATTTCYRVLPLTTGSACKTTLLMRKMYTGALHEGKAIIGQPGDLIHDYKDVLTGNMYAPGKHVSDYENAPTTTMSAPLRLVIIAHATVITYYKVLLHQ